MPKFFPIQGPGGRLADTEREALVREEVRFLLQGRADLFSRELTARLLEEGCNLPPAVALPLFYREAASELAADLGPSDRAAFARRFPGGAEPGSHIDFHRIVRFFHSRLSRPAEAMARASLAALAAAVAEWRIDERALTRAPAAFDAAVRRTVARMTAGRPSGRLAALPFERVARRLRLALCAALLRHLEDGAGFRAEFGAVPSFLKAAAGRPDLFCRAMADLRGRIPYFDHLASRAFWRTLRNLDAAGGGTLPPPKQPSDRPERGR